MLWLDNKRNRITQEVYESVESNIFPEIQPATPTLYWAVPKVFDINISKKFGSESQFISDDFNHIGKHSTCLFNENTSIHTSVYDDSLRLYVIYKEVDLTDSKVHKTAFSFIKHKKEPSTLFSQVRERNQPAKLTIDTPLKASKSPDFDTKNLEERLRLLLLPPINSLLSDSRLSLPEKPFPFQVTGIKWLFDRDHALLADEMGLGKSMQAIIAARLLWKSNLITQVLIICPKSLIPNWKNEILKWWPQSQLYVIISDNDRRWFLRLATPQVIIKIINYESLRRELDWIGTQNFSHDLIIIDEAQKIKNPEAETSKSVKALKSKKRWALTGTPLENRIEDLISIFDFVKQNHVSVNDFDHTIKSKIQPYILRRRTDEVLKELPEKFDDDIPVELFDDHMKLYQQAENEGVVELNSRGDTITITHVFALILKLRQICNFNHTAKRTAKFQRLLVDFEEIVGNERKALIFSQFVSEEFGIKRLAQELNKHGYKNLEFHGRVRPQAREAVLSEFLNNPNVSALLLNYSVGGVGLNLQAANYVYLYDRWWNPAVEDQAVKRAHRLGQTQKVFVKRFYCKDTIEERIIYKLKEKRRLFQQIIDDTSPAPDSMGLTEEEIFSLFDLKVRPHKTKERSSPFQLNLNNTNPEQFEVLVSEIYRKQGYTVRLTPASHDEGVDIYAEKEEDGTKQVVAIQCKHQINPIGRPVLQQLGGVINSNPEITRGDLVTSSSFSKYSIDFSDGKRLTLIDRKKLCELAEKYNVAIFVDKHEMRQNKDINV